MKKNDLLYKLSLQIIPRVYNLVTSVLFATCRITSFGREHFDRFLVKPPMIVATWHCCLLYDLTLISGHDWVAMVSKSSDAEYISRLIENKGYETVRGSQGKGGLLALKKMVRIVKERQTNSSIVADGSQGPPRRVQAGVIILASRTGARIVPLNWAADRYITFKSWDKTILPKPFARMVVYYGEPITIPPGIKADAIEAYRLRLEETLNADYHRAWKHFGVDAHDGLDI